MNENSRTPSVSRVAGLLVTLAVAALWLPHLDASLWGDELQTAWVVKDGLMETVIRAFQTQGFTPFYYLLLWLVKPGMGEMALRLPSILLTVGSAAFVFALARLWMRPSQAWLSLLVFVCMDGVIDTAVNARPYSLALFLSVASTYFFVRWLRDGGFHLKCAYVATAVLTVYAHFLFGGIFAVHAAYYLLFRNQHRLSRWKLFGGLIYIPIGLLPVLPQVHLMLGKKAMMAIAPMPSALELFFSWVPWIGLMTAGLAYFFALALVPAKDATPLREILGRVRLSPLLTLLLFWLLFPPTALFIASHVLGSSLFVARYFEWASPAAALLLGMLLGGVEPQKRLMVAAVFFVGFAIAGESTKERFHEDWRSAVSAINKHRAFPQPEPVLLYSGVVEATHVPWMLDPIKQGQFSSPIQYYRVASPLYLLPFRFDVPEAEEYWTGVIEPKFADENSVTLLVLENLLWLDASGIQTGIRDELEQRMMRSGFKLLEKKAYGRVWVLRFRRLDAQGLPLNTLPT